METELRNIGYDESHLATMQGSTLCQTFLEEIGERDIIYTVVNTGEVVDLEDSITDTVNKQGMSDGVCKILYLSDFNGVCNIDCKYTDVLGAYVGTDGKLSFLVSSADDKSQLFVSLYDFTADLQWDLYCAIVGHHTDN
jgi:hypothetical protein